jgi:hypothetical protein
MFDALLIILTTTFNISNYQLTVAGGGFAENRYPVSAVAISLDGSSWTNADTIKTWGDDTVVVAFASKPAAGVYRVRITSSDNVSYTLTSGFSTMTATARRTLGFGFGMGF